MQNAPPAGRGGSAAEQHRAASAVAPRGRNAAFGASRRGLRRDFGRYSPTGPRLRGKLRRIKGSAPAPRAPRSFAAHPSRANAIILQRLPGLFQIASLFQGEKGKNHHHHNNKNNGTMRN